MRSPRLPTLPMDGPPARHPFFTDRPREVRSHRGPEAPYEGRHRHGEQPPAVRRARLETGRQRTYTGQARAPSPAPTRQRAAGSPRQRFARPTHYAHAGSHAGYIRSLPAGVWWPQLPNGQPYTWGTTYRGRAPRPASPMPGENAPVQRRRRQPAMSGAIFAGPAIPSRRR